jgi:CBS domain-containing protein
MKVEEIMIRNVKYVRPNSNIKDVAILICTNHISGVPVVDYDGKLAGIISEKDIIKAMYPSYIDFYYDPVRSRDFEETEGRYAEILKAGSLMVLKKIRRLPVVDKGKIVGIVSMGDIHQAIFKKKLIR